MSLAAIVLASGGVGAAAAMRFASASSFVMLAAGFAAAALIGAFPLPAAERHLAALDPLLSPKAPRLLALARVPIAVLLLCGLGCLMLYGGIAHGASAGQIASILCLLVAAEMTLRVLATLFLPFPPILRRRRPVAATVRDWFGIDLTRNWAIAFVRAALAPVLTLLVLFGWAGLSRCSGRGCACIFPGSSGACGRSNSAFCTTCRSCSTPLPPPLPPRHGRPAGLVVVLAFAAACLTIVGPGEALMITAFGNPVRVLTDPGQALRWPAPFDFAVPIDVRLRTTIHVNVGRDRRADRRGRA